MTANYDKRKRTKVDWTDESMQAFENMKKAISGCPTLYFRVDKARIILETDASDYGIGAYLYQIVDEKQQPLAFISKSLTKPQQRWSTIEKSVMLFGML